MKGHFNFNSKDFDKTACIKTSYNINSIFFIKCHHITSLNSCFRYIDEQLHSHLSLNLNIHCTMDQFLNILEKCGNHISR
jgi:hypothetical protein